MPKHIIEWLMEGAWTKRRVMDVKIRVKQVIENFAHKFGICLAFVESFLWEICLNNKFKSFGELFGSILV